MRTRVEVKITEDKPDRALDLCEIKGNIVIAITGATATGSVRKTFNFEMTISTKQPSGAEPAKPFAIVVRQAQNNKTVVEYERKKVGNGEPIPEEYRDPLMIFLFFIMTTIKKLYGKKRPVGTIRFVSKDISKGLLGALLKLCSDER